ncbi:MAG: lytic transglycosylase domain-containing protein [Pseudomonadota bacterium]|jgi:soluble lytic murein transglycosylase-like protein
MQSLTKNNYAKALFTNPVSIALAPKTIPYMETPDRPPFRRFRNMISALKFLRVKLKPSQRAAPCLTRRKRAITDRKRGLLHLRRHASSKNAPVIRRAVMAFVLACASAPQIGRAMVLEIDDNGAVRRFDGPARISYDGAVEPLRAPRPVQSKPSARVVSGAQKPLVEASLRSAAKRHAIHQDLVESLAKRESNLNPEAVSKRGALGVMQLMPATARALRVDARNPTSNINGGTAYLSGLLARYHGDIVKALAAYNAGPAAVDRHGGVPPNPETRAYVGAVLEMMAERVAPRTTRSPRP